MEFLWITGFFVNYKWEYTTRDHCPIRIPQKSIIQPKIQSSDLDESKDITFVALHGYT
jgi:hypothetical protein